jgi:hypothetical protein
MSLTTKKKTAGSAQQPIYFECYPTTSAQLTRMNQTRKPVIFAKISSKTPRVLPVKPHNITTSNSRTAIKKPRVIQTTPSVYSDFVFLNEIKECSIQHKDFRNALINLIHNQNIEQCQVNKDNNQVLKYSANTKNFQLNIIQASRSRPTNCFLVNIYNIGVALEKNKNKFKLSTSQSNRFDKIVNEMKSVATADGRTKDLNYFKKLISDKNSQSSISPSTSGGCKNRSNGKKQSSSKNNLDKCKKTQK